MQSDTHQISFLDLLILCKDNVLYTDLYRKQNAASYDAKCIILDNFCILKVTYLDNLIADKQHTKMGLRQQWTNETNTKRFEVEFSFDINFCRVKHFLQ